jgi:hypothetical protein
LHRTPRNTIVLSDTAVRYNEEEVVLVAVKRKRVVIALARVVSAANSPLKKIKTPDHNFAGFL